MKKSNEPRSNPLNDEVAYLRRKYDAMKSHYDILIAKNVGRIENLITTVQDLQLSLRSEARHLETRIPEINPKAKKVKIIKTLESYREDVFATIATINRYEERIDVIIKDAKQIL